MHSRDSRETLNMETVAATLGESAATFIELISRRAQANQLPLFLVGGVVRDLLLGRRNFDLDFVVDGDAAGFASFLADEYGGAVHSHPPFGTAKWILDAATEDKLWPSRDLAEARIDFAIAREETYESPAALPTVIPSTIDRDLARRDFSINALALQLSPEAASGRIVDSFSGRDDLDAGLVRVLHQRSFIDDPTRVFRAMRFAVRLDFEIEAQTKALMLAAVPTIARLSGERIRNELHLILSEPEPERIIRELQSCGAIAAIESEWNISERLPVYFARCRESLPPWSMTDYDLTGVNWHLLMAEMTEEVVTAVCDRLTLTRELTNSITTFARLLETSEALSNQSMLPSQVTRLLNGTPAVVLHALWIFKLGSTLTTERIETFISNWRTVRPQIDGNDLIHLGLQPGPCFRKILATLRDAWIDGEIRTGREEHQLLQTLIGEGSDRGINSTDS